MYKPEKPRGHHAADGGAVGCGHRDEPQSPAQRRLWFLHQVAPQSLAYHVPWGYRLSVILDGHVFKAALHLLVRRHEALRTTLCEVDGEPFQRIHEWLAPAFSIHQLSRGDGAVGDEVAAHPIAVEDCRTPFDLGQGPLLRVRLHQSEGRGSALTFCAHHAVVDAWSISLLMDELLHAYDALSSGRNPTFGPVVQYSQANWMQEEAHRSGRAARTEARAAMLRPLPDGVHLPHPIDPSQHSGAGAVRRRSTPGVNRLISEFARNAGTTPFVVTLALLNALLARYGNTGDVIVGTPVFGRDQPGMESAIGCFVNIIPVRTNLGGDPAFRELLARTQRSFVDAIGYQEVPFDTLVNELGVSTRSSRMPIVDILFSYSAAVAVAELDRISFDLADSKSALVWEIAAEGDDFELSLEHDSSVVDPGATVKMATHFFRLTDAALAAPDLPLSQLPMFDAEEGAQRQDFLPAKGAATVPSLFADQLLRDGRSVAVVDEGGSMTYAELDARAVAIAAALRTEGVGVGSLVAVQLPRGCNFIASMLGAWKAGAAFLPIDISQPMLRNHSIIADAGVDCLIVASSDVIDKTALVGMPCVSLYDILTCEVVTAFEPVPIRAEDVAYVIYTSGSTGAPKGVEIEHGPLAALADWFIGEFGLTGRDRVSQIASVGFDASVMECFPTLSSGATLFIAPEAVRSDPDALLRWLVASDVTVAFLPTALLEEVVRSPWPGDCALRAVCTGGDVLHASPPPGLPFVVINAYGPTECTVIATALRLTPGAAGRPSIGRPIPGVRAYVLDAEGRPVPDGVEGELYLGGSALARGYRRQPGLTAAVFLADPHVPGGRMYRTGDRVRRSADGLLQFLGRTDDQIKIRGFRVELAEVESALRACINDAPAAVLVDSGPTGPVLHAYVAVAAEFDEHDLKVKLSERLPSYMRPATIRIVDGIALNAAGKVDRAALRALAANGTSRLMIPPATHSEKAVADVWSKVLGRTDIGIRDDFFALGGHSLLAIRAVGLLNASTGGKLTLADLMREPDLASLAELLDKTTGAETRGSAPPIDPQQRDASAGLQRFVQSAPQKRLWFIEQMERGNSRYNIIQAFHVCGELDGVLLQRALDALVRRHEALRTTFEMAANGELFQVVHSAMPIAMMKADLKGLGEEEAMAAGIRLIEGVDAPYDLEKGPLLRAALAEISESRKLFVLGMHHIITDAWSMETIYSELSRLYDAEGSVEAAGLHPLRVQYPDYSLWQDQWMIFGVLEERLHFWQHVLRNPAEVKFIQRETPHTAEVGAGEYRLAIPPELTAAARRIGAESRTTLFVVFLAVYKLLLGRYSSNGDVVVGLPVANRPDAALEGVVGYFVNSLPVRTQFDLQESFVGLVGKVRRATLDAYSHQDMPIERLIERMGPDHRWQRAPLFRTMVTSSHGRAPVPEFRGCIMETVPLPAKFAKFDLSVDFHEEDGEAQAVFEHALDVVDEPAMATMATHFLTLLKAAVASPTSPIASFPLVTDVERLQQISSAPAVDGPPALSGFLRIVAEMPSAVAVEDRSVSRTYAELDDWSDRVAAGLLARGVTSGDVVAIALPRGWTAVAAMLGVWKAGAAYLPLDLDQPPPRRDLILADGKVVCVITELSFDEVIKDGSLWTDRSSDGVVPGRSEPGLNDLAYVIYTSGSTGKPKGVEVEHGTLSKLIAWQRGAFGLTSMDRCSQTVNIGFDASVLELWGALATGATVCIAPDDARVDADELSNWIRESRVTVAFVLPALAETMFKLPWPSDCALRVMLIGGDVVRRSPPSGLPFAVFNNYGPTEHTVVATSGRIEPGSGSRPSIGHPLPGVRAYVLDPAGAMSPDGIEGELYLAGTGVARGYRGLDSLNAERFLRDPFVPGDRMYRTGDRVRRDRSGSLHFVGRIDDQIKIRGFRIEPAEIESVLTECECVARAVVVAEAANTGTVLRAFVVAAQTFDPESVRKVLTERLPTYMHPLEVVEVEDIPVLSSGKPDRQGLRRIGARVVHMLGGERYEAPADPLEVELVSIWERLLDHRPIGRNDDFFSIGGHSINSLVLRREIARCLGVDIEIPVIFANGRLADLAQRLRERGASLAIATVKQESDPGRGERAKQGRRRSGWFGPLLRNRHVSATDARIQLIELRKEVGVTVALVHAVAGTVAVYREIAEHLDGFRVIGVATDRPVEVPFVDAGRAYAESLAAASDGPFIVAGWSAGGGLALETARSLAAVGHDVRGLLLLDAYLATHGDRTREPHRQEMLDAFVVDVARMQGKRLDMDALMTADLGDSTDATQQALLLLRHVDCVPTQFSLDDFRAAYDVYAANYGGWRRHEPAPYAGNTLLMVASESMKGDGRNPLLGWADVLTGRFEVSTVAGDHYGLVVRGGAVTVAAACSKLAGSVSR